MREKTNTQTAQVQLHVLSKIVFTFSLNQIFSPCCHTSSYCKQLSTRTPMGFLTDMGTPDAAHMLWAKDQILSQSRALYGPLHPHGSTFDLILTTFTKESKPSRHHQTERTQVYVAYVVVYEIPNSAVNWKTVVSGAEKTSMTKSLDDLLGVLVERLGAAMAPKKTGDVEMEREIGELYRVQGGPPGAARGRYA
ncbi:hypothetical protein EJ02DRAFT_432376 [Clathrospora elynae]|uniref:Uncharacterized protein n=1 Tax=Clathrospora elynae TaxID=706981 RepID=A0A6A5SV57_9PLEO|nr:hypothetical protein EJ02DRAFT_432376 [Clathrospora elynae]